MKTDANWHLRLGTGVLALSFAFAVASCGKGGGAVTTLNGSSANQPAATTTATSAPQTITNASDIAKLPPDQQKLFTDPGWNQPYIQPDPATVGLPAPSSEELLALTRDRLAKGDDIAARGVVQAPGSSKSSSWIGQGSAFYGNASPPYGGSNNVPDFDGNTTILTGEYFQFAKTATPTYGCNADGNNIGGKTPANAIEDTLAVYPNMAGVASMSPINYVLEGLAKPNWFNTNSNNHGGNAQSAVYQIWCSTRTGQPGVPSPTDAKFAEISFRSDKTAYGAGPGGGQGGTTCTLTPVAHGVYGYMWKAFNRNNNAQPNNVPVRNYDILIAPADEGNGIGSADASFKSSGGSQTEYQTFYFGSVGACYGGAQIVGLSGTTSSCQAFKDIFTPGTQTYSPGFFYNPIYGVVLKRWQQLAPPGAGAWKGPLGSPVFGPIAYNSGNPTQQPGKKWFAWGWYFEKGFMWYVDNDQALFPNTPDEAQVYTYSANNTYCTPGTYTQQLPSTFFLGNSASVFKVNVGVTGYSTDGTTFNAPFFNTTLGRYQIGMDPQGATNEHIYISANCSGYGGQPDAACNYKNVIWAWRDGQITGPFPDYTTGQTQTHEYAGVQQGKVGQNKQNIYVIRVQIQDSANSVAYGDSLPMELGGTSSLPDQDVLVVNDASGSYASNSNYTAVIADLDSIKTALPNFTYKAVTYNSGTTVTDAKKSRVVIWFRGGPDQPGSLDNSKWGNTQPGDLKTIMTAPNPRPVLNMSQNMGIGTGASSYYVGYGGWLWYLDPVATPGMPSGGSFNTPDTFLGVFGYKSCTNGGYQGMPASGGNVWYYFSSDYSSNSNYMYYFYNSSTIGETYSGANSSGFIPSYAISSSWPHMQQTIFSDNGVGAPPGAAGTVRGATVSEYWDYGDCESIGNTSVGTKNYTVTYSWAHVSDQLIGSGGIQRWHLMRNMLASLDSTIGSGTNGGNSFGSYSGSPEIVSVAAHQFLSAGGINQGNPAVTGVTYPDAGTYAGLDQNVYRKTTSGLPGGSNYIICSAARGVTGDDALNGNDMQFDFPFYAYVTDPNGSVTVNGTGTLSGDETIAYAGLLLVNNGSWTRVNPAGVGYKNWATLTASLPSAQQKAAAGYYWGTAGTLAGTKTASYGQGISNLTFDNRDGSVSFECIAHWPASMSYGASPATVRWSLYPAHGVADLNNVGHYYGERSSFFTKWISDTDIDPSVTPPASAPKRNSSAFNIPDFNFQGNLGQGRVADFNYGTIKGWDGDIDRDNVRGEDGIATPLPDDKFPARCRIFTNYTNYLVYTTYVNYPDWVPDPNSFLEGGVYVVDKGPAITKVSITDDPAKTDPKDNVSSPSANVYDVKLGFIILYGDPGYVVEYNPDFTGSGVWAVIPGNPPNASDPMDPVNGYAANGSHFPTVRVNQPVAGDYTFGVRVTDLKPAVGGDLSGVYTWPNKVPLKPPMKSAVMSDPKSLSPGGKDAQNMQADLETIYGTGSVDPISKATLTAGLAANSMNSYDIIAWPSDIKGQPTVSDYFFNFGCPWTPGPGGTFPNFTAVRTAHQNNKAAVLMFGQDAFGTGTAWGGANIGYPQNIWYSSPLRDILPIQGPNTGYWTSWYYDGSYPDAYGGSGYNIFGSAATTPNTVGNMTGLSGPNDPGSSWSAFQNGSNFMKYVTDSANYPVANCEFFSASWFPAFGNTYICGCYARKNVSTDQALVMFNANWGDLTVAQGPKTRAAVLENLLCAGKATSRYNSLSYNP